jgi:amino acid adenylation domain-containing protein
MTRVEAISDDAQAGVVLSVQDVLERSASMLVGAAPRLREVPWVATDTVSLESADSWTAGEPVDDMLAVLQYTSGSTGRPKGVMLTHANLMHNCGLITCGFNADRDSVGLSWLPTYHDMGLVGGVLNPLYVGRPSVLMSPLSFLQKPVRWLRGISRFGVTISGGPNFAYALCNEKITDEDCRELDLSCWKVAFNGAEPVRARTLATFTEKFQRYGFRAEAHYPCYGMAEATLIITGAECEQRPVVLAVDANELESNRVVPVPDDFASARHLVASGRVLPDQQVVIVDPHSRKPLSNGLVGEIWVESDSVAVGYWNNEEETRRAFHGRLVNNDQRRFLRTGDLGFFHDDQLFVTGRTQDLIIINGRNLYPHDIESVAERAHGANRVGGVVAFSIDQENSEQLVIVQELERGYRNHNVHEITAAIRKDVFEVLDVAAHAILLLKPGKLPKTSSGKVQRRECREQYLAGQLDVLAQWQPGLETRSLDFDGVPSEDRMSHPANGHCHESIVAWLVNRISEQVRIPHADVDVNESFSHFGLDSVALIGVSGELENWLEFPVSPRLLFVYPTIAELAEFLARAKRNGPNSALAGESDDGHVVSDATSATGILAAGDELTDEQDRNLPSNLLEANAGSEIIHHPMSHGQRALWFIYQMARDSSAYNIMYAAQVPAGFDRAAFQRAFQSLLDRHETLRTTFAIADGHPVQQIHPSQKFELQTVDARGWQQEKFDADLQAAADVPFDLEQGPVLRVQLFERHGDHHVLLFTVHHIALDFWAFDLLLDELERTYRQEVTGIQQKLPAAAVSYRNFVSWQEQMLNRAEGRTQWEYWQAQLDGELPVMDLPTDYPRPPIQSFRGKSLRFKLDDRVVGKLSELAKNNDVSLFATCLAAFQVLLFRYSGQHDIVVGCPTAGRSRVEFDKVLGYFVNPVALRARLSADETFREFLKQVRTAVVGGITHQDYPFPMLVERLQAPRDLSRSPIFQVAFGWDQPRRFKFDDTSDGSRNGKPLDPGSLGLQPFVLGQQGSAFDLMMMVLDHGDCLSAAIQYNLDLFSETTIAGMVEHFQVLLESIVDDPDRLLADLPIISHTEKSRLLETWNNTAAEFPSSCVHELFEMQVERTPDAIAVQFEETRLSYRELNERANQVAHYLAGLGVGPDDLVGVHVDRSVEMLVGLLGVLKAGGAYVPLAPGTPRERITCMLDEIQTPVILTQQKLTRKLPEFSGRVICLDGDRAILAAEHKTNPTRNGTPTNLAYVIFTSGSTGKPKGVQVEHRSVVNFLTSMRHSPRIDANDVLLAVTTFAFDISVLELMLPLTVGAKVVVVGSEVAADGIRLAQAIRDTGTTMMQATPATWRLLIEAGWTGDHRIKILCGGEALAPDLAAQLLDRCSSLWNMYGPTETTIWSTVERIQQPTECVTIGRPIANTQIFILDSRLNPVPVGVAGNLFIGGDGLARGYLNRPDLTAEKFVEARFPFGQTRLYNTGDLARYRSGGKIEFLGREDFQVKIRGFRIELGEIEGCLGAHPAIGRAIVIALNVSARMDDKQLVAYFTSRDRVPHTSELRRFLKRSLPEYMVPAVFIPLNEMPLNPAGKIDRRALPEPGTARPNLRASYVAPGNETEAKLASIWSTVLGLDVVGVQDDFFDLGGASMQSLEITSLAAKAGIEITPSLLFQYPTITELAAAVPPPTTIAGDDPMDVDRNSTRELSAPDEMTAAESRRAKATPAKHANIVMESIGVYIPSTSVTTDEIIAGCRHEVAFPLEEITGIKSRPVAAEDEFTTELACRAVERCLDNSKYAADQMDLVICCHIDRSVAPRSSALEPCTAMYLKRKFGFPDAVAFDVSNACAGMFTGIRVAKSYLNTGAARRVLVVSAEFLSPVTKTAQQEIAGFMDPRMACLTLGDAAAAIILEVATSNDFGFHELEMYSLGKYNSLCIGRPTDSEYGGPILLVPDPIKHTSIAIEHSIAHSKHVLERVAWKPGQIQHVIMHQTSARSLHDGARAINQSFGYDVCTPETTINNLSERGNTASTSHIVAVWDNILKGRVNAGDKTIFAITGSGQTIGTGIYTFDDLPDRIRQLNASGCAVRKSNCVAEREEAASRRRLPRMRVASIGVIPDMTDEPLATMPMVKEAVENCLANSAYQRSEIDLILFAGVYRTGFIFEPAIAAIIAGELKINDDVPATHEQRTLAFDVFNGGAGFLNACDIALQMMRSGEIRTALIVASEVENNRELYPNQTLGVQETASAIIVDQSADARTGFGEFVFKYMPEELGSRTVTGKYETGSPCVYLKQDPNICEMYLKLIPETVDELLEREGLAMSAIRVVLPPQFSGEFLDNLSGVLKIPREIIVDLTGHGKDLFTSAVPCTLDEVQARGLVQSGDIGLVISVGSGLQVGCAIYYF